MYSDQHILSTTAPVVAVLPSTGGDIVVQLAIAAALGMLVWGALYSLTAKGGAKA